MNQWESLPKPWTKEQCRRRYVECDDEISFTNLAKLSGIGASTLFRWSTEDIKNDEDGAEGWVAQRERFVRQLREVVTEKTLEKTSEKLSTELSQVAIACYKPHKMTRDYATEILRLKYLRLRNLKDKSPDEIEEEIKKHHISYEIDNWSKVLTRSTDAIIKLTGLDYYVNLNAAAAKIESEGYIISDPTQDSLPS